MDWGELWGSDWLRPAENFGEAGRWFMVGGIQFGNSARGVTIPVNARSSRFLLVRKGYPSVCFPQNKKGDARSPFLPGIYYSMSPG